MPQYRLVDITTGLAVAYGDDLNQVFGGPYGDRNRYQWVENVPTQAELDAANNASIKAQIIELEQKAIRAMREVALGVTGSLQRAQDIDNQIATLRAQLK